MPSPVAVPDLGDGNIVQNDSAAILLSYTSYGFVKAWLKKPTEKRVKMLISGNGNTYSYDLKNDGSAEIYPLQFGNGSYTVSVMLNTTGSRYVHLLDAEAKVSYIRPDIPFLVPSQQVNYSAASYSSQLAKQLVGGKTNNYERISVVLSYVAKHISYDYGLAANPPAGYVPDPDSVLRRGKGICYDYAAVSAAMLRSLGYPTKLVTGYVNNGEIYHAWNEVYLSGRGWIKVMSITVNTKDWSRVDVTFISTATSPSEIEAYIGDGSNYVNRFVY